MPTSKSGSAAGFSAEERAAMKEHAQELRTAAKRGKTSKADGEADLLAKIAEMAEPDRSIATRIHEIVMTTAPDLTPKTWYGQPAWAKDGKVVCFFQAAAKFKTRYATLGFSDAATIDDGTMWPTAFGLTALTAADETRIAALVKKAVSGTSRARPAPSR
ncbi:iron chaperone [Nocardia canadensis]|uniref:iron chaperone n=1 Tax=Nocardia canadensis TaxID=3065238 RepID=UPI00292DEE5F|nr:DUF1801 domain-containing protein [Nocardia canadensis]